LSDKCIACGMPMERPEDFAMGDVSRGYCVHCARADGSMQNYGEKLASMSRFIARERGVAEAAARDRARTVMARFPAWREHID